MQKKILDSEVKIHVYPPPPPPPLIKTLGDEAPKVLTCNRVKFAVTDTKGNDITMDAYSLTTICSPISNQSIKVALEEYPHLRGLNLADTPSMSNSSDVEVDILIGADYYWKFITGTTKRGAKPGPVAVLTKLGWVLSGPVIQENQRNPSCTTNLNATHVLRIDAEPVMINSTDSLYNQLEKLWDLETLGIRHNEFTTESRFMEEINFDGKQYEIKLPFREEHPLPPSLLRSLFAGPRFSPHVQAAYCSNTFHSDCLANHSLSTKIRNSFALKFTNSKTKMASYDQAMCEVAHYFVFLLSTNIRRMRFEQ